MADPDPSDTNKAHNAAHSGRKAEKKKAKRSFNTEMDPRKRNPKAFAIQSVNKAEKRFRRTMDIKSKKLRLPEVSRIPVNPPPAVVAVVGPPQVGKTTLMQCMIKSFTRQNLSSVKGPVTVVSGKKKRLTLIECSNDINSMIDIAKVADLVLLLIDAKSGFEMETFEFLNICQVHGMPRIMGVLTHLDLFKNKKILQRTKTLIKKRYRTEIPRAEKMFHFSGLLHGEYLRNEVHNLTRFISVMIFEPSSWQKSHPYIFADRMEDITNPEQLLRDQTCDRTVCLYGYARGGALKKNTSFHIPGCGDYVIKNMHFLPDPCPLPDKEKRRSLNQKERLIYAPMSGVGGIVYDKDAVYIELRGSHSHIQSQEDGNKPSEKLMSSLITTQHPIDTKMAATELSLFSGADPLTGNFEEEENIVKERSVKNQNDGSDKQEMLDMQSGYDSGDFSDNDGSDESFDSSKEENSNLQKKKVTFSSNDFSKPSKEAGMFPKEITEIFSGASEEDSEDSSAEIGHVKWKEHLKQKAANSFYKRQQNSVNIQKLVYGNKKFLQQKPGNSDSEEEELGGLFHVAKHEKEKKNNQNCNALDCSKFHLEVSRDWSMDGEVDSIKDCFVTGKWHDTEDAENLLKEDDELFGDFEDYEADKEKSVDSVIQSEDENEIEEESSKENDFSITTECKEKTLTEKRMAKKLKLKELFNSQLEGQSGQSYHDELKMEVDEQTELNRKEFEDLDDEIRVQYEGYRPGLYLRLEVEQMPCEFVNNFDPSYPIIVGSLLKGEDKMGYVQVRLKKHRWYPRILKSRDPLIISLGWRRFQTIPLYFIQDHNFRNRHLKYTPKHLHCLASFWGPITAQKSGILALQSVSEVVSNFRIAAVGTVLELNRTTDIVKKLKLIGTPMEIFRKTGFIEGMFHSAMEVAKYEGAAIRTVSGIRGQIKKSLRKPPGVFRATFEDKILKSDIVFLRTWVKVTVPQFCSIIHSLLLPLGQKDKWQGMKTSGQLRYERGLHAPVSKDSLYTPIERKLRQFTPLVVPRNIQKNLPFRDKIIHTPKSLKTERVAVIREPHEREVTKLLDRMKLIHKYKTQKANRAMWLRARAHKKEKRKEEAIHHQKLQAKKKRMLMRRNPTTR